MTALAQRITETPMAPYMALMRGMTREEKEVVIAFLIDLMEEYKPVRKVPAEFKKLRGMVSITDEDKANDERLAYIMER